MIRTFDNYKTFVLLHRGCLVLLVAISLWLLSTGSPAAILLTLAGWAILGPQAYRIEREIRELAAQDWDLAAETDDPIGTLVYLEYLSSVPRATAQRITAWMMDHPGATLEDEDIPTEVALLLETVEYPPTESAA